MFVVMSTESSNESPVRRASSAFRQSEAVSVRIQAEMPNHACCSYANSTNATDLGRNVAPWNDGNIAMQSTAAISTCWHHTARMVCFLCMGVVLCEVSRALCKGSGDSGPTHLRCSEASESSELKNCEFPKIL